MSVDSTASQIRVFCVPSNVCKLGSPIMLPPTLKAMHADDVRRSLAPPQGFALAPAALQSLGCVSTAPATSPPAPATVPTPRIELLRLPPTASSRTENVHSSAPARNKNALCSDRSRSERRSAHPTLHTLPTSSASYLNTASPVANAQDGLQIALTKKQWGTRRRNRRQILSQQQ